MTQLSENKEGVCKSENKEGVCKMEQELRLSKKQLQKLEPLFDKINEYYRESRRLKREACGGKAMLLAQIRENGTVSAFVVPPELAAKMYTTAKEYWDLKGGDDHVTRNSIEGND